MQYFSSYETVEFLEFMELLLLESLSQPFRLLYKSVIISRRRAVSVSISIESKTPMNKFRANIVANENSVSDTAQEGTGIKFDESECKGLTNRTTRRRSRNYGKSGKAKREGGK